MEEQSSLTTDNSPEVVVDQAASESPSNQPQSVDANQGINSTDLETNVVETDVSEQGANSNNVSESENVALSEDASDSNVSEGNAPEAAAQKAPSEETIESASEKTSENISDVSIKDFDTESSNVESSSKKETAAEDITSTEDTTSTDQNTSSETKQTTAAEQELSMTMEEALAASDEQNGQKPIHRGMMIKGTIIMLAQNGIIVDVGAKIEGVIPYNQLFEQDLTPEGATQYFKPNDEIQVFVIRADIPNNIIVLSKKRADQERAWNLLQHIYEEKKPVEVEIIEKVRGGLVANLGVRAFLPASQVDVRRISDLDPYVGQRVKVRIIELHRRRNRIIISRRSIIEDEVAEKKADTLQKLEPGLVLEGEVVKIADFGIFVNLGGVDGLVHRSEISYQRFNHPKEVVSVGDVVKVEVLDMDLEHERINLSMKKLMTDPWEAVLDKYTTGQKVSGHITNLTPFGAFVEVEAGLEGLIHVSEMSWTKRVRHPKEVLKEGDFVEAMVLKIDLNDKRLSLGLRQTRPDPWSSLPDNYPPGTEITGPITGITEFGIFMEIEDGIEGLIHVSEIDHKRIENIKEEFNKGDEINAVILNIDPIEQRASLSRKRLLPYTPEEEGDLQSKDKDQQRKGGRKGRRGGRRSQGIDYDYSYATADNGSKSTTKLGDVYADLFAQFGLTDAQSVPPSSESDSGTTSGTTNDTDASTDASIPKAKESSEAEKTESPNEPSQVLAETAEESSETVAQVLNDVKTDLEATSKTPSRDKTEEVEKISEEPVEEDPENAIDAIEAAAMLTAAFRQGKKPLDVDSTSNTDGNSETEVEASEESNFDDASAEDPNLESS